MREKTRQILLFQVIGNSQEMGIQNSLKLNLEPSNIRGLRIRYRWSIAKYIALKYYFSVSFLKRKRKMSKMLQISLSILSFCGESKRNFTILEAYGQSRYLNFKNLAL